LTALGWVYSVVAALALACSGLLGLVSGGRSSGLGLDVALGSRQFGYIFAAMFWLLRLLNSLSIRRKLLSLIG